MPRRCYPMLDIKRALQDADDALHDVLRYLEILEHTNGSDTPHGAATLSGNVKALRLLLRMAVPPPLDALMLVEQRDADATETYMGTQKPPPFNTRPGCPSQEQDCLVSDRRA
jgi:hypothetical protein